MKPYKAVLMAAAAVTILGACTPTHAVRGNLLQDHQIAEVKEGDTQHDILRKLGSPTTQAPFDENVWYYMGQETEKRGVLDPEVLNERIVTVTFDESGMVQSIEDSKHSQRVAVPFERRKTQTSGNDVTALQQFFGNLGRFNH